MKQKNKQCRQCKKSIDVPFDTDICSQCVYANHYKDYDAEREMRKTIVNILTQDSKQ